MDLNFVFKPLCMSTDSRESYQAANEQAIQELKESEERYRNLIEQARDGVVLLQDGLVSYANQSLCTLVGYSREELLGSPFEKYIPEDLKAKITDNYRRRMNSEPAPTIYEAAILHKSGVRLETEFNAGLTQWNGRLADLVYLRDIRERKLAEKERDQIFNLSHDLVGIAGFDGYFKQINPAWEVVLGYTNEELMANSFLNFIHPEDKEKTEKEVEKLASGQSTIDFENRYIHKDGSIRHISWSATPLPELCNLYCIGRDVSERKKTEEQILGYQLKLKDLSAELLHAEDRQHKQLAANLHDHVGQLLASSRLQLAALNKKMTSEEILSKTRAISEGLLQAIQATREVIFDLSPPQLNEIGLYAAVADWQEEQIEMKHGIRTRLTGDDQIYPMDSHLRFLIFRSIRELLHNVVKHARATEVEVGLHLIKDKLEISVKDNGVGFTYIPEMLRLKNSGFGLFTIQDRVESLGGDVEIQSSPGLGTSILLKVPLF